MKKNKFLITILSFLLCFLLSSCHSKEEGPKTYEVTGDSVPSINNLLDGEGGVLSSSETPNDSSEEASEASETHVYHYTDLPNGGQTIKAYVDALTASDVGFSIVNGAGKQTKAPDFTAEEGSLNVSKPNFDLRKNLQLILEWKDSDLTVTVFLTDAALKKDGSAAEGSSGDTSEPMTADDAVSYLKGLSPSKLGLPGESMKEYRVYYMDGKAMIDGNSCLRLRVYQISPPEGSNAILATYFLSPDKTSLYRLNPENNQPEVVSLS